MEKGVGMIAAVSSALEFRKTHPSADSEKILRHVSDIAHQEKDIEAKLGMIAAASRAIKLLERNPSLKDREVIKLVMDDLPEIAKSVAIADEF